MFKSVMSPPPSATDWPPFAENRWRFVVIRSCSLQFVERRCASLQFVLRRGKFVVIRSSSPQKSWQCDLDVIATSHEIHSVPNYWQCDCLCKWLIRLTTKTTSKRGITCPSRESYRCLVDSPLKESAIQTAFPCHYVIMPYVILFLICRMGNAGCYLLQCRSNKGRVDGC